MAAALSQAQQQGQDVDGARCLLGAGHGRIRLRQTKLLGYCRETETSKSILMDKQTHFFKSFNVLFMHTIPKW